MSTEGGCSMDARTDRSDAMDSDIIVASCLNNVDLGLRLMGTSTCGSVTMLMGGKVVDVLRSLDAEREESAVAKISVIVKFWLMKCLASSKIGIK